MPKDRPTTLRLNLDDLNIGQITLLEVTLNQKLREYLPDSEVVTFNDVVATFNPSAVRGEGPVVKVPMGLILQTLALVQLRMDDPDATWDDAGELKVEVDAPKEDFDPTAFIKSAAAPAPADEQEEILRAAAATYQDPLPAPTIPSGSPDGSNAGVPTGTSS